MTEDCNGTGTNYANRESNKKKCRHRNEEGQNENSQCDKKDKRRASMMTDLRHIHQHIRSG